MTLKDRETDIKSHKECTYEGRETQHKQIKWGIEIKGHDGHTKI